MTRNIIRIITLALILAATIVAAFWLSWKLPTSAMLALSAAALSFAAGTAYWRLRRKPESEEADRPESNDASAPASPVDS